MAHERDGRPCQDAIRQHGDASERPILCIADGHGSERCFRSEVGSRFAVEAAERRCRRFIRFYRDKPTPQVSKALREELPPNIVRLWRRRVERDLARHPLDSEPKPETESENLTRPAAAAAGPYLAYGTTLLFFAACPRFLILGQIGDGDALILDAAGDTPARPLPQPAKVGVETESLCQSQASSLFRVMLLPLEPTDARPVAVLLATDGVSDSYRSDADFFQVLPDLIEMLRCDGIGRLNEQLPDLLTEVSAGGVGDDATLGLAVRSTLLSLPSRKFDDVPNAQARPATYD